MNTPFFTDEHREFAQSVRKFVEKEITPHVEDWEKEGAIPKNVFRILGEMGYLGINYPEKWGGSNLDFFYSVVFLEELIRSGASGLIAAVGVQSYMATPPILHIGSDELKEKYLIPTINGTKIGALAISEPNAGSDVANIRTYALKDGDDYIINGSKTFITNGANADFVTLAVKTNREESYGGISLFMVDTNTPGFKVTRKLAKLGWWCSDTAELAFTDMRVPKKNLLGSEGKGFYYIMNNFQLERLVAAITSVAGVDFMLEKTLEYMASREAFGRPINKFQVLRHRIADLYSQLEAARSLVYSCAYGFNKGDYLVKEVTMAKLFTTELAIKTANECVQMYGGYGVMEEYPAARMYRDTRIGTLAGGSSEIMREIIARIVIDNIDFKTFFPVDAPETDQPPLTIPKSSETTTIPTIDQIKNVAELMATYPKRLNSEKAAQFKGTVHFAISGSNGGEYTVKIANNTCSVEKGLIGDSDCRVDVGDDTYLGIEKGTTNPQMAFMMGQIKVTNISVMMTFMTLFHRLKK